jgi:hypothetical protein
MTAGQLSEAIDDSAPAVLSELARHIFRAGGVKTTNTSRKKSAQWTVIGRQGALINYYPFLEEGYYHNKPKVYHVFFAIEQ